MWSALSEATLANEESNDTILRSPDAVLMGVAL